MSPRKTTARSGGSRVDISVQGGEDVGEPLDEGVRDDVEQSDAEIESAREELPDRKAFAIIYRIDEDRNEEVWVDRVSPSVINTAFMSKRYGGGRYVVKFYGPDLKGKVSVRKHQTIEIDRLIPATHPAQHLRRGLGGQDFGGHDELTDMGSRSMLHNLIHMSNAQTAATLDFMKTISAPRGGFDWDKFMAAATLLGSTVVAPVVSALLSKPPGKDPVSAMLEGMTALRALHPPPEPTGMKDVIALAQALDELRGERGGSESDSIWGVMSRFAPVVEKIVERAQQSAPPAPPDRARAAFPLPSGDLPSPTSLPSPDEPPESPGPRLMPPSSDPADPQMLALAHAFQPYLQMIAAAAARNADPAPLAETLTSLIDIPDAMLPQVRATLAREDVVSKIQQALPALRPYTAWLGEFVLSLRQMLDDPDEGEHELTDPEEVPDA